MKTVAVATALFASVVLAVPPPQTPEELLTAAKTAIHRNDGPRAAELLEKAVALRPNSSELHYWLSVAYTTIGQTSSLFKQMSIGRKVIAELERSVQLDPAYIDARLDLAQYYAMAPSFMGGGEEKAREQAVEVKKRDAFQGHCAFANVYTMQKKYDLARNELLQAVREEPNSARARTALGKFLARTEKNYTAAFEEIEKAIQLDPAYEPAWFRLGETAALSGTNLVRGEEALKKYLTYEPNDHEPELSIAHYRLGQIYEKEGKKAEARQSYAAAVRMRPGTKTFEEALKSVS
jgi:tetratricopeptide (TPR) repeat protein